MTINLALARSSVPPHPSLSLSVFTRLSIFAVSIFSISSFFLFFLPVLLSFAFRFIYLSLFSPSNLALLCLSINFFPCSLFFFKFVCLLCVCFLFIILLFFSFLLSVNIYLPPQQVFFSSLSVGWFVCSSYTFICFPCVTLPFIIFSFFFSSLLSVDIFLPLQ